MKLEYVTDNAIVFTPKKLKKKIGGPRRCAFMRPPQTHPLARPAGAADPGLDITTDL